MIEAKNNNEGCIVIVVCVLVFLVVLGLALFMSQREESISSPTPSPAQRFRARPGTTREQAVALTSRRRDSEVMEEGEGAQDTGAPRSEPQSQRGPHRVRVRSLSRPEEEENLSGTELAVREAMNSLSAEQGIARLEQQLTQSASGADKMAVHRALAQLYMQRDPPDVTRSEQALDHALGYAADSAERYDILLEQTRRYLQRGEPVLAQARLTAALNTPGPQSAARLRLELAQAQILEMTGVLDQAAEAYAAVAEAAADIIEDSSSSINTDADEVMRLSMMRLTRMYREHDRNDEADRIAEEFERNFPVSPAP